MREALSLPPALVTVSETVLEPVELKLVLYVAPLPLEAPPLQAQEVGAPPLSVAVQVTDPSTVGDDGEHVMPLIAGGEGRTVRVTPRKSKPAPLLTKSATVCLPASLKLVM